jgi:perosamine synthetase
MKNILNKNKFIPLSVPSIQGNEWRYIKECLDTNWVSSAGKYVDLFEKKIAEYTGAEYAVACVNGTSALHISLILSNVGRGDEVIVPTLTFIAPVNAIKYLSANPVFMDADNYCNIDINKTIKFIKEETVFKNGYTFNKESNNIIKAIIPVHIFGNAILLDELYKICKERNIKIIEDATESLGTHYIKGKFKGKYTGTIGDLGCLSFNGNKIITTGGGGMILTNNKELAERAKYLTTQAKDDEVRFIHNDIGYNYRMTNIQAAMGVAQLEKINDYLEIKEKNYNLYKKYLENNKKIKLNDVPEYSINNRWLYTISFNQNYKNNWEYIFEIFKNNNIQTRPIWQLNHLQKAYKNCRTYKIINARKLWKKTLCIPSSVNLSKNEIKKISNLINSL